MKFGFALVGGFCLFGIYSANTVLSSLLPSIRTEYSLSPVILGLIVSAYGWSYAAMQIPVGIVSDIFEPRKITALSMLAYFVSTLAFAFSPTGTALVLSRVLMGVGASFVFVNGLKAIEYIYDKTAGLAVGIFVSISFCGIAVPNLIASLLPLASVGGWRVVYLGTCLLSLIGSVSSFMFFPKNVLKKSVETSEKSARSATHDIPQIIRNRQFLVQNMISFIYFGSFFGVLFWLPSYLEFQNVSTILAGIAVFLYAIGAVVGFAVGGWLIHRYGRVVRNLRFFVVFYTIFMFVIIISQNILVVYEASIFSFLLGLGVGGSVANTRIVGGLFHKTKVGTAYGIFNTVGWLGSAFYPLIIGYLLSAGYAFSEALLPLGISMIVAVMLSILTKEKSSKDRLIAESS